MIGMYKLKLLKVGQVASLIVLGLFVGCNQNGSIPTNSGTVDPTATVLPNVVLQVNGEGVTIAEFESELARYQEAMLELGAEVSYESAYQVVLDDFISSFSWLKGHRHRATLCRMLIYSSELIA